MEANNFPDIYIIYSSWSIDKIRNFLNTITNDCIGLLKIIYDNEGNETNKTIAVIKNELYNNLKEKGYTEFNYTLDFKIKIYKLPDFILPPEDRSSALFIPTIKKLTETYVTDIINNKLLELAKVNIIPIDSWKLKCPITSRFTGFVKQGCFIIFNSNINIYSIATIRFLLNNTYWEDNEVKKYNNMVKCHWAKKIKY
jgi:hypothetical protein